MKLIIFFFMIFAVVLVTGCMSNIVVPDRFSSALEAYPQNASVITKSDLPSGSSKTSSFEAPYEDVFRAVTVSTGQAMLNIEYSSKDKGLILATKAAKVRNAFVSQINQAYEAERRHYLAIIVKEKGPETTEVKIVAKVQTPCQYNSMFGSSVCGKEASVTYASDMWHSATTEMNNIMIFIRNNLYSSGLL